jgi:hypothetical protein
MSKKKHRIVLALAGALLLLSQACTDASAPARDAPAEREQAPPPGQPPSEAPTPEPAKEALPAAEEVLAKAVDAVGGKTRLEAIESTHSTGRLVVTGQNIAGEMEAWWKGGEFYEEITMAGIGRIRAGKQGDTIWSEDPILGLRKLEGKEAEQAQWLSVPLLAASWQRFFTTAKTTGAREVDGKQAYDVTLTSAAGDEAVLSFAAESGLQVALSFSQVTPMGAMPFRMKMEDYRDVEGLKVSFRKVTDASVASMVQEITKIEFNVEVDETKFAMPSAPGAAPGAAAVPAPAGQPTPAPKRGAMPFGPDGKPGRPVPPKKQQ